MKACCLLRLEPARRDHTPSPSGWAGSTLRNAAALGHAGSRRYLLISRRMARTLWHQFVAPVSLSFVGSSLGGGRLLPHRRGFDRAGFDNHLTALDPRSLTIHRPGTSSLPILIVHTASP
jgi:hypothetical protein